MLFSNIFFMDLWKKKKNPFWEPDTFFSFPHRATNSIYKFCYLPSYFSDLFSQIMR